MLSENLKQRYWHAVVHSIRQVQWRKVSIALAAASLTLETLAASYLVEARFFYQAVQPHWVWPHLTSLSMTSELLAYGRSWELAERMLIRAADVATQMPELRCLEIWSKQGAGPVMLRYQAPTKTGPGCLTSLSLCKLYVEPDESMPHYVELKVSMEAIWRCWQKVALRYAKRKFPHGLNRALFSSVVYSLAGYVIYHLTPVQRMVSMQQESLEKMLQRQTRPRLVGPEVTILTEGTVEYTGFGVPCWYLED